MKNQRLMIGMITVLALLIAGGLALYMAPYVDAELERFPTAEVINKTTPALAKGGMVDDYWAVQEIGPNTYAIGEPRYYQQNYSYLILGTERALLFDAGSGTRDIRPIIAKLTTLPVTVLVSHLHFDHLGGAKSIGSITLADFPQTRADVTDGLFTPTRYEYMGVMDGDSAPTLRVAGWQPANGPIDLGGRRIEVISAPGHTPTSLVLYDPAGRQLFAGDFLYPGPLYAFLPGASLSAYRETARRLLAKLPPDTILWAAHCCRANEDASAPWLGMGDLKDLDTALSGIRAGTLPASGFYPRRYPVNAQMTLETGFAWNNR